MGLRGGRVCFRVLPSHRKGKPGSSETSCMLLSVLTCFWPRYMVLIMPFLYVCLMKAYPHTLFFIFGNVTIGKSTSSIVDTNGLLKNPTCFCTFWQYIVMPAAWWDFTGCRGTFFLVFDLAYLTAGHSAFLSFALPGFLWPLEWE